MKTEALDKCLDFILNWQFLDINDHHDLFLKGDIFGESHIEPLRRELIENLVMLDHQQQANVITFYVNELNRVAITDFFKTIEKHEINDDHGTYIRALRMSRGTDVGDPFFYMIYQLHLLIFREIGKVCEIYKIPFKEILKNHRIDPDTLLNDFYEVAPADPNDILPLPSIKPIFLAEFIPQIFELLKDFFSKSDQRELLKILETGGNTENSLLFLDNGTRLADAFKQLFDCGIVRGCQKKEFEEWICKNFRFRYRADTKVFSKRYIADIVSSTKDKCQKPILNVRKEKSTGQLLITKV